MDDKPHWLDDPAHVRLLWRGFLAVLALTVAAELVVHLHPHFEIDAIFGFGAWFGLLSGFALVVVTKSWAIFVKRKDTYYD